MKKIVFITNNLGGGGAEKVMSVLANNFSDKGYAITFLLMHRSNIAYPLRKDITLIYKDNDKEADYLGQIKFIRRYMKNNQESVYISFFTRQSLYTIIASRGLKVRIIVSERNDPEKTVSNSLENSVREFLYGRKKCYRIVCQTDGARDYFKSKVRKKCTVIPNPLKSDLPISNSMNRRREIVAVGRLTEQKNYPLMLNAFSEFSKTHRDFCLKIYGEGELKPKLVDLCEKLGISEKVFFEGFHKDVHSRISGAWMYVISSDYEGLSNALMEAMAIGLPCISTDTPPGGARMIINDGENGIIVPVGDVNRLSQAMCRIADEKGLAEKLSRSAVGIRDELSERVICEKWICIIEQN